MQPSISVAFQLSEGRIDCSGSSLAATDLDGARAKASEHLEADDEKLLVAMDWQT